MKKKRTLSPEHLAKLQAGRQRALAQEAADNPGPEITAIIRPALRPKIVLDVTKENVVNETDLLERIRRMFDDGNNPDQIKVTSRQMMDILDNSTRLNSSYTDAGSITNYSSPFGDHEIKIIPAKDIHEDN